MSFTTYKTSGISFRLNNALFMMDCVKNLLPVRSKSDKKHNCEIKAGQRSNKMNYKKERTEDKMNKI